MDVGINQLVPFFGQNTTIGKRVTVQFKEGHPKLSVKKFKRRNFRVLGIFCQRKSKPVFL